MLVRYILPAHIVIRPLGDTYLAVRRVGLYCPEGQCKVSVGALLLDALPCSGYTSMPSSLIAKKD